MAGKDTKCLNIDKELHAQAKIEAAKRRVTLKELVEAAIRLFLDSQG